jgi:hypothetical protein
LTLSASQPAKIDDWNTRASKCMADLVERLGDGDEEKVGAVFRKMQKIAREQKFDGETIDGWISAALKPYTRRALVAIYVGSINLLPSESLLADSVRLGIRRMLTPRELIKAIMEDDPAKVSLFAGALRDCCNPAKLGDKYPDDKQARDMMNRMLDGVLATFSDMDLYELD